MSFNRKKIFEQAQSAWRAQEDRRAIEILSIPELEEDAEALCLIGEIYDCADKRTSGLARSTKKARAYWLRAMALGSGEAAHELGSHYHLGEGVQPNQKKAESYWKIGIELGDPRCHWQMADLCYDAAVEGAVERIEDAIDLCQRLIDMGEYVGQSLNQLGKIHHRGIGVVADEAIAKRYWRKGVKLKHPGCCWELAVAQLGKDPSSEDLDEGERLMNIILSVDSIAYESQAEDLLRLIKRMRSSPRELQ